MRVGSAPAQARARDDNDRRSLFAVVVVLQGRWTCAHLRPRLLPLGDPRPVRRPRLSPATRGRRRCPFSRRHFLRRSCSARVHHPPRPAPPRRQRRVRHGCRILEGRGRRPRGRLRQLQRRPRQPRVRRDGPPHHEGLPRGARVRPARGLGHRLRRALPRGVGGRPRPGQHLNPGAGQRRASAGRDHIQAGVAVPREKTRRVARGEESRENPRHALPGQGEGHARAGVLLEGRRAVHVLAHVLSRVGFKVGLVPGGYKRYRAGVLEFLRTMDGFRYHLVAGKTGCAKGKMLDQLAAQGAQVLDLEVMAQHRGSVLGEDPAWNNKQPSQKFFDTRIWEQARGSTDRGPSSWRANRR